MSFAFENNPRISLSSKLVPVHYQKYEYGVVKTTCDVLCVSTTCFLHFLFVSAGCSKARFGSRGHANSQEIGGLISTLIDFNYLF